MLDKKPPTIEQLRDLLADKDKKVRDITAILLLRRGQYDMVPVVLQIAADVDTSLREDALYTLKDLPPEKLSSAAAPAFVGRLAQRKDVIEDEELFMSCVNLLTHIGDATSIEELEGLVDQEDIQAADRVYVIVDLLKLEHASAHVIERARQYLARPDVNRVYLARWLAQAGDPEAIATLERWLGEPGFSREQKIEKISPTLLALGSKSAEVYLSDVVQSEEDYRLRFRAAALLSSLCGNDEGFTTLLDGAKNSDPRVRALAVEELGRGRNTELSDFLKEVRLNDPDPSVRHEAVVALNRIKLSPREAPAKNESDARRNGAASGI